jgi:pyruvate kinase
MLSGETAAGKYPVESVETMARIALRAERDINYLARLKSREPLHNPSITDAISHSACLMAGDLDATSIVAVSKSGRTAQMVSKYRPQSPIIGGSLSEKVCRQLNLSWGVTPLLLEEKQNADELFEHALERARAAGLAQEGDTVVLIAGVPVGIAGTTNLIKAHIV